MDSFSANLSGQQLADGFYEVSKKCHNAQKQRLVVGDWRPLS